MKINAVVISFIIFSFSLTGCNTDNGDLTEQSDYGDNLSNVVDEEHFAVKMTSHQDDYASNVEQIPLEISNFGLLGVEYGAEYQIEKLQNNTWYKLPLKNNIGFPAIANIINPGESSMFLTGTNILDYELTEGEYRIIKRFTSGESNEAILAFEFKIID